jgi:biopolymer transport protein ExbD
MAMNVGSPSRSSDMDVMIDINTTPLVDVMQVLLIIFINTEQVVLITVHDKRPTDRTEIRQEKP